MAIGINQILLANLIIGAGTQMPNCRGFLVNLQKTKYLCGYWWLSFRKKSIFTYAMDHATSLDAA
jgi:hypothetical protein